MSFNNLCEIRREEERTKQTKTINFVNNGRKKVKIITNQENRIFIFCHCYCLKVKFEFGTENYSLIMILYSK